MGTWIVIAAVVAIVGFIAWRLFLHLSPAGRPTDAEMWDDDSEGDSDDDKDLADTDPMGKS